MDVALLMLCLVGGMEEWKKEGITKIPFGRKEKGREGGRGKTSSPCLPNPIPPKVVG